MNSKLSEVFANVAKIDNNEKEKFSGELHNLETELDKAGNDVRDHLRSSKFNLEPSQIEEIIIKSFSNLKSGI